MGELIEFHTRGEQEACAALLAAAAALKVEIVEIDSDIDGVAVVMRAPHGCVFGVNGKHTRRGPGSYTDEAALREALDDLSFGLEACTDDCRVCAQAENRTDDCRRRKG